MAVLKKENSGPAVNIHDVHTVLGPESSFEGKLVFEGTVRIDGRFKGQITTKDILVIGQGARVEANITVGQIVINGEIIGDVHAKQSVELNKPARLRGNIFTPQLMIEKGVIFEGSCKMENLDKVAPKSQGSLAVVPPPAPTDDKR
ncbi:uncharacterized protein METZ01_LOCUS407913 [marine metagenome]|uniref:Polymer-forming cytoskeletal family protein n=1 Tax=marine metagenome TaxID=408172 RepID=A0A382W8N1_9ZZZZ